MIARLKKKILFFFQSKLRIFKFLLCTPRSKCLEYKQRSTCLFKMVVRIWGLVTFNLNCLALCFPTAWPLLLQLVLHWGFSGTLVCEEREVACINKGAFLPLEKAFLTWLPDWKLAFQLLDPQWGIRKELTVVWLND